MPRLIWTGTALADVERLHRFLKPKNARAASHAIQSIRKGVNRLSDHPLSGRSVEGLTLEYRECVVPFGDAAYVMLYRFEGDEVSILAIRHGREAGYPLRPPTGPSEDV